MAYNNEVKFVGNLGKTPVLKFTDKGTAYARFSLAVTKGKDENKSTMWLDVTVWGDSAETVAGQFEKGNRVTVVGRLEQPTTYEWKGETRMSVPVVADEVTEFVWRDNDQGGQQKPKRQPRTQPNPDEEPFRVDAGEWQPEAWGQYPERKL